MLIRTRLMLMGFGSTLLATTALTAVGVWQTNVFHAQARQEVDRLVSSELTQITRSTYDLIESQDQSISRQVDGDLSTARHVLARHGPVQLSQARVAWTATNQFTRKKQGVILPKMLIGGSWLGQNATFARPTPIVDEVKAMGGDAVTIFQCLDRGEGLLRVGTNVRTRAGLRAVGTYIPAVNPDGHANPVVASVLAGRTYHGNAFVVNAWYVSDYQPLFDAQRRVIGAIFTGVKQESAPALRQAIQRTRVGRTGAVMILGSHGTERGRCRISPGGRLDGQDLWNARDGAGDPYVQRIVAAALAAAPGTSASVRYPAPSPGGRGEVRVAQAAYYAPWDWVIVADTDQSDFQDFGARLREGQTHMILTLLLVGCLIAGGGGVILYREARQISGAAREVSQAAGRLATGTLADFSRAMAALGAGDLEAAHARLDMAPLTARSRDEVGAMAGSFNAMQEEIARAALGLDGACEGLRAARREMAALATTDPITGLPNHRAVVSALELEMERSARFNRPCALLFLDIDHFKALNDGCGHVAGDAALAEFGAIVRDCLRGIDTVGRWGGEEFVALLPETDRGAALVLAEVVRETVASHGFRAGGGGHLTCSQGVAVFPDDAQDLSGLVAAADRAMYAAKRLGRNQVRSVSDSAVVALGAADGSDSRREATLRGEVEALATLVAARDRYTGQHTDAVSALAIRLALALGQDAQAARMAGLVGQLHDVGKVAIPDAVLQKPGRLTEEEWALMRRHPVVGADVVSRMPSLRVIAPSIRGHHERWDGAGYPDGLSGEEIPLASRIVAVADAYGAMTTDRPYRRSMAPGQALAEMHRCSGTQFDPEVVAALAQTLREDWDAREADEDGAAAPALLLAA